MNVNCLSCGHTLDLRDAYDDYEGWVKCFICGALLAIHTQDGQVKSVETAGGVHPAPAPVLEETCLR
jgi:ribosomal protein S27E